MSLASSTPAPRPNIGSYANEQEALDAVVARLVGELDPQAIWLFGSRARGDHRPDSDFDLLVVSKEGHWFGNSDSDGYDEVYAPVRKTGVGCDIVPCDAELFEVGQKLATSFIKRIVEEGREVYRTSSLRGAIATRQSMFESNQVIPSMDCIVISFLAMTMQQSLFNLKMPI